MLYNTHSTLQSGAASAFNFRMHLLTRRQGKFSLPTRFLIRGDLLELYRENIRGHDGSTMRVGGRTYRFIENPVTGTVTATCEIKKPVLRRRKSKDIDSTIMSSSRRSTHQKPKVVKISKKIKVKRRSPATITEPVEQMSVQRLDAVVNTIRLNFSNSGSMTKVKFDKMLEENDSKAGFCAYASRRNWVREGANKCLILAIPGKHDAYRLRPTKTGYQLISVPGGLGQVSSQMELLTS